MCGHLLSKQPSRSYISLLRLGFHVTQLILQLQTCAAWPFEPGSCREVMPIGGSHVFNQRLGTGNLAENGFEVSIGKSVLNVDTPFSASTNMEYDIELTANRDGTRFRGFLVRLASSNGVDTSEFLMSKSNQVQVSPLCSQDGIGSLGHTSNSDKLKISGTIFAGTGVDVLSMVVTVVERNGQGVSEWYTSKFAIKTELKYEPLDSAKPSIFPTVKDTPNPTVYPSSTPPTTEFPTVSISYIPTVNPSISPTTLMPTTSLPTAAPFSASPTKSPSISPTTNKPTLAPLSTSPTKNPSISPTTNEPALAPLSTSPTKNPSISPTTNEPALAPLLDSPTSNPSIFPTTSAPTLAPLLDSPTSSPGTVIATSMPPTSYPSELSVSTFPTVSAAVTYPSISPATASETRNPTLSLTNESKTVLPSPSPIKHPHSPIPSMAPSLKYPFTVPSFVPTINTISVDTNSPTNMKPTKTTSIVHPVISCPPALPIRHSVIPSFDGISNPIPIALESIPPSRATPSLENVSVQSQKPTFFPTDNSDMSSGIPPDSRKPSYSHLTVPTKLSPVFSTEMPTLVPSSSAPRTDMTTVPTGEQQFTKESSLLPTQTPTNGTLSDDFDGEAGLTNETVHLIDSSPANGMILRNSLGSALAGRTLYLWPILIILLSDL